MRPYLLPFSCRLVIRLLGLIPNRRLLLCRTVLIPRLVPSEVDGPARDSGIREYPKDVIRGYFRLYRHATCEGTLNSLFFLLRFVIPHLLPVMANEVRLVGIRRIFDGSCLRGKVIINRERRPSGPIGRFVKLNVFVTINGGDNVVPRVIANQDYVNYHRYRIGALFRMVQEEEIINGHRVRSRIVRCKTVFPSE